jgi:hypothetical protein
VTEQILHKRGDTFAWLLELPEVDYPDGYFIGWEIAAQIRKPRGTLIDEFETTWAAPEADTRIIRIFAEDTTRWPIGDQEVDVQFTRIADQFVRSSETFIVKVVKDITIPAVP